MSFKVKVRVHFITEGRSGIGSNLNDFSFMVKVIRIWIRIMVRVKASNS